MSEQVKSLRKPILIMLYCQCLFQAWCILNLTKTLWFPADEKAATESYQETRFKFRGNTNRYGWKDEDYCSDLSTYTSHIILTVIKTAGFLSQIASIIVMRNEYHSTAVFGILMLSFVAELCYQFIRFFACYINVDKELHDIYNFPLGGTEPSVESEKKKRIASTRATIISVVILAINGLSIYLTYLYVKAMNEYHTSLGAGRGTFVSDQNPQITSRLPSNPNSNLSA